jgi:hypothetical protein
MTDESNQYYHDGDSNDGGRWLSVCCDAGITTMDGKVYTCMKCNSPIKGLPPRYDCGCINHRDDENVGCESCGYLSCLDCHHINSTDANIRHWICYEGYGCKKVEA